MRRQRNFSQLKEQEKNPEKITNETKISNLPDKEFKAWVIRMLPEVGESTDEHSKNSNKDLENIKKESVRTEKYNKWNEKHTRRN